MEVRTIPIKMIDIAEENVRKDHPFGNDEKDQIMKDHLSKFDLLQPVVVRFDDESRRYKLLIGRRRYLALSAKGKKEIPAVVTELEGAEAEAASLFENLIRKDLSTLEKARIVKRLVDSTRGGMSKVSTKYGLPKSTLSEWLSILTLPSILQDNVDQGKITTYEAIRIARKPKEIQNKLSEAARSGKLQLEMSKTGVTRGAPKGLLTVRLVFDPRKKADKQVWDRLNFLANESGLEVTQFVRGLLVKHLRH